MYPNSKRKKMQTLWSQLQVVKSTSPGELLHYKTGQQNTRKNKCRCGNPFPVHVFLVSIMCMLSKQGGLGLFAFIFVFFSFSDMQNVGFNLLSTSYLVFQPKKHKH